jgi:hypothetical protein
MFRSSTIIRELVFSLAKVMLEHSVNYVLIGYAVVWQHVLTECSNITLARLCTSSLMMVEDRNM